MRINVNKPWIPNIEEYFDYLEMIWKNNILTNCGPLHEEFEKKIIQYLDIKNGILINNCTNGLLMALSKYECGDEIITTPFSFAATASTISWSKLKPIFCDIDENNLFINTNSIENMISKNTKAVLATHIYGNTGDIDHLENVCKYHKIDLLFDAAHAFGVLYKNKSIMNYGDVSILSFHATKVFHSIEGGIISCKENSVEETMRLKRNFGYKDFDIVETGINSKMSEFHAAMGLCCLKHIDEIITKRKTISDYYDLHFKNSFENNSFKKPEHNLNCTKNYSYYPLIFNDEECLTRILKEMNGRNIYPRRYFNPSLDEIFGNDICPISRSTCKRIVCLPLYYDLDYETCDNIINIINKNL